MAASKRKRRLRGKIFKVVSTICCFIVFAGIVVNVGAFLKNKIPTILNRTNIKTETVVNSSDNTLDVIKEKTGISYELAMSYPTLEEYIGVTETELKNIEYNKDYNNVFTDYGYVNSVYIKANSEVMLSKNLRVSKPVTEDTILTEPGVYYISSIDTTNNVHTFNKYTIPPVQELIEEMDLGDDVKSIDDLRDVINSNLDIYNTSIKFNVSNEFISEVGSSLQPIKSLVQDIIYERPELSCKTYTLQVQRNSDNTFREDSTASIVFTMSDLVSMTDNYEGQTLFLFKSADAWLASFDDQDITQLSYIKSCLDYAMYNFDYSYDNVSSKDSEYHSLSTLLSTHTGLCDSFSNFMNLLCNTAGIPSELMVGTSPTGESHGWNNVKYNGRDYMLDVTSCITMNLNPSILRVGLTAEDFRTLGYGIESSLVSKNYSDEQLLYDLIEIADYDGIKYKVYDSSEMARLDDGSWTGFDKDRLIYYTLNLSDGKTVLKWTTM